MPLPDDRIPKLLALCADDYGLSPGISLGIAELALAQRITAVSCITNAPHWEDGAQRLRDFPASVGVGLHFNLTEGRPLSPQLARIWPRLPSLATLILRAHLGLLPVVALAREFEAQWAAFSGSAGWQPAFVDGHQHVHHLPGVREALLGALERLWARPAIRSTAHVLGPASAFKRWAIRHTGGKRMENELDRRALEHNSCLLGTYDFRNTDYRAHMRAWMSTLPSPGGLAYCHPGRVRAGDAGDPIAGARAREMAYLAGASFPRDLAAANIKLVREWR